MISSGDNALIFPYDQLSNLANYLAIFIFIQIFYRKKYISKKKNIYLSLFILIIKKNHL